jgi:hypothetical protein
MLFSFQRSLPASASQFRVSAQPFSLQPPAASWRACILPCLHPAVKNFFIFSFRRFFTASKLSRASSALALFQRRRGTNIQHPAPMGQELFASL